MLSAMAGIALPSTGRLEPFQDIDLRGHYEWFVDGKRKELFWSWGEGIVAYLRDNLSYLSEYGLLGVKISDLDFRNVTIRRVRFVEPYGCVIDDDYPEIRVTRSWIEGILDRHKDDISEWRFE